MTYDTLFLRNYARSKLATDPLYAAVAERLRGTSGTIVEAFPGFEREVVPLWGRTPFNNYLFVFRK